MKPPVEVPQWLMTNAGALDFILTVILLPGCCADGCRRMAVAPPLILRRLAGGRGVASFSLALLALHGDDPTQVHLHCRPA
jgi:hypothetical protein